MAVVDQPTRFNAEESNTPSARQDADGPVTTAFSDLDLSRWKQYDDIITGSL